MAEKNVTASEVVETYNSDKQKCYFFKLHNFRMLSLSSPMIVPPEVLTASRSRKGGRRKKVYATLVSSSEGLGITERCQSVLISVEGDTINLEQCRKILFSNWTAHAMMLLQSSKGFNAPLQIFDLPSLKLKLICCPDPRPKNWLQVNAPIRVTIELVEDDNTFASTLLMANCGWDLTQVTDIFGSVLVFSANGDDLKLRRLQGFVRSYFTSLTNSLHANESLVTSYVSSKFNSSTAAAIFAMPENIRQVARLQRKGKIPPTDLLSHYDRKCRFGNLCCGSCSAKEGPGFRLNACSKCQFVFYCNRNCQKAHWPDHKNFCRNYAA